MNHEEYIDLCQTVGKCLKSKMRWFWVPVNLLLVPAYAAYALAFCAYCGFLNLRERGRAIKEKSKVIKNKPNLVGAYREKPNYTPWEIESTCVLCGGKVWITLGAAVAKSRLKADGFACFECLGEEQKGGVFPIWGGTRTKEAGGDGHA